MNTIDLSIDNVLKQHKREQTLERLKLGDVWEGTNKIFTQWNGKAIHPDMVSGWFSRFLKRHSLPHISVHGLRHMNATLLIAGGSVLRTVSKRLGHSNMTPQRIYTLTQFRVRTRERHSCLMIC